MPCSQDMRLCVQLSGARILTMQWMEGCKISDAEGLRTAKIRPRDVGNVLLDAFARMQYVEGWIHGDAHSGNLLVRPAQHQREALTPHHLAIHFMKVVAFQKMFKAAWDLP